MNLVDPGPTAVILLAYRCPIPQSSGRRGSPECERAAPGAQIPGNIGTAATYVSGSLGGVAPRNHSPSAAHWQMQA